MSSDMEIEDCFMRILQDSVVSNNIYMPLLSKHLKGHVPDGIQTGIASNKFQAGSEQILGTRP